MKPVDHIASVAASAFITPAVIASADVPDTKEKVIGLVSAVLVQTIILGFTELRRYLARRKKEKAAALTPNS